MKKDLIYLFVLLSINVFSQNIKTYDGDYESPYNFGFGERHTRATYQYYENENYERIYHGNFNYISRLGENNKSIIQGKFNENNKVGNWSYSTEGNNYYLKINGNYSNNLKQGVWNFYESRIIDNQKKVISYTLNFKNNIVIGEINVPNLIGKFDQNGNFSGKWRWDNIQFESLAEFDNNVLLKFIHREVSTGKIYSKYIPNLDSIYSNQEKLNLTKFKKVKFNHLNNFSEVFECSQNRDTRWNQSNSFYEFLNEMSKSINCLLNDQPFSQLGFLDYIKLNTPEVLVINPEALVINNKYNVQESIEVEKAKREMLDKLIGGIGNSKRKITGDPNANGYYGNGGGEYQLGNRKPISRPKPNYICDEEGLVVVSIEVNVYGRVINATPGIKGSTNTAACLLSQAKEAALNTTWQPDSNAPSKQIGVIKYRFSLSQ